MGEELTKWEDVFEEAEVLEKEADNQSNEKKRTNMDVSQGEWKQEEEAAEDSHNEVREGEWEKVRDVEIITIGHLVAWMFRGMQRENKNESRSSKTSGVPQMEEGWSGRS